MSKTVPDVAAQHLPPLVWGGLALIVAALAAGAAFGGWAAHGEDILAVLWQTGLSWCL